MKKKKIILPLLLFFGTLLLLVLSQFWRKTEATLTWDGYVDARYTYLAPHTSGRLQDIYVVRGTEVKKDQVLAKLEEAPEVYQLRTAEFELAQAKQNLANMVKGERSTVLNALQAEVAQSQVNLKLAKTTLVRKEQLRRKEVLSKAEYDEAVTNYHVLENKLIQAKANLAEAKLGGRENLILATRAIVDAKTSEVNKLTWNVKQKTIIAPISGIVFDTYFQVGELVPAQKPILSLINPADIYVVFFVPPQVLGKLQLQGNVKIQIPGKTETLAGKISYISPSAEYTPPIIYSAATRNKLVFRIEANVMPGVAKLLHPGAPIVIQTAGGSS